MASVKLYRRKRIFFSGNAAFDIADQLDIIEEPSGDEALLIGDTFLDERGQSWVQDDVQEPWEMIERAEAEELNYDYQRDESLGHYYDKILDQWTQDRSPDFKRRLNSLKDYYHR